MIAETKEGVQKFPQQNGNQGLGFLIKLKHLAWLKDLLWWYLGKS
jgi:hypothetical protein